MGVQLTLNGVLKYWYDANGNMTRRVENGMTYTQTWDVENRLSTVTVNGQTTTFTYDGDGQRVKEVEYQNDATFHRSAGACPAQNGCWAWTRQEAAGMAITVYTSNNRNFGVGAGEYTYQNAAHELGHAFAHRAGIQPYNDLQAEWDANLNFPRRDPANVNPNGNAGLRFTWQQSSDLSPNEEFADMFLGWAYGRWETDRNGTMTPAGQARSQWMTTNMAYWITLASGQ